MAIGTYMQGVSVLLKEPVTRDQVEAVLKEYQILKRVEQDKSTGSKHFGWPGLVVPYRLEVNGLVSIKLCNHPWPDSMGDPKKSPMLFGAWGNGNYGPYTWPGSLERAGLHSYDWEPGKTIAQQHKAAIIIGLSFIFGDNPDAPVWPADYRPEHALGHITKIAATLLKLPQALCYFNPGGEVLRDREGLRNAIQFANQHKILPFDIWMNVRFARLEDSGWGLLDLVGNAQLGLPDFEAYIPLDQYDPNNIKTELLNSNIYLSKNGDVFKDGDTFQNTANIVWQCKHNDEGLLAPARPVISLKPAKHPKMPKELMKRFK